MIFSVLAFIMVCLSVCIKERKKSLFVQSFNCIFEGIYDFLVGAYTATTLSILNFIRTICFIKKDNFSNRQYFLLLILFLTLAILNCIFTWQGLISLLPTIGTMIRIYCLWQSSMTLVRISGLTTGVFYGSYYVYYQSWFLVLGDIVLFIVSLISIYQYDFKKTANNRKMGEVKWNS